MIKEFKGAIFDLDGVIVDTAKYHYYSWKKLAKELGFNFTWKDNERLKGVSRIDSLEILLQIGNIKANEEEKKVLAERKNNWYLQYIDELDENELLPGAREYILYLRDRKKKIALGSASKNALRIIKRLKIKGLFDAIIDGTKITRAKPDPETFLLAAAELALIPEDCVVYEDASTGIEAAKRAGMRVVGVGNTENLKESDFVIKDLSELL